MIPISEALKKIDWSLLHRQKLTLLAMRDRQRRDSPEAEALAGIIHLLDALQDEAADGGLWSFPNEDNTKEVHDDKD